MDKFEQLGRKRWGNDIETGGHRKEPKVTLTNNTKRIEALASIVVMLCDGRQYEEAHVALDDIEKKVHEVRRHIDKLQNLDRFAERPAGGE